MHTRASRSDRSRSPEPARFRRQFGVCSDASRNEPSAMPASPSNLPASPAYSASSIESRVASPSQSPLPYAASVSAHRNEPEIVPADPNADAQRKRKLFLLAVMGTRRNGDNLEFKREADEWIRLNATLPYRVSEGVFGQSLDPDTMFAHFLVRGLAAANVGCGGWHLMQKRQQECEIGNWTFQHEWLIQVFMLASFEEARNFHYKYKHFVNWPELTADFHLACKIEDNESLRIWGPDIFGEE